METAELRRGLDSSKWVSDDTYHNFSFYNEYSFFYGTFKKSYTNTFDNDYLKPLDYFI